MALNIEELETFIRKDEALRQKLWEQVKPIQTQLAELYDSIQSKKDQIAELRLKDADAAPDWAYLLNEGQGMVAYRALGKALSAFKMINSGYLPVTNQYVVKISLVQDSEESFNLTLKGLTEILPHIIPVDGEKHVGVFESTLSEHGIYWLTISETKIDLHFQRYGQDSIIQTFPNLEDALRYMQKHHYYERLDQQEEED